MEGEKPPRDEVGDLKLLDGRPRDGPGLLEAGSQAEGPGVSWRVEMMASFHFGMLAGSEGDDRAWWPPNGHAVAELRDDGLV